MVEELFAPLFTTAWGRRAGLAVFVVIVIFTLITFIQTLWTWQSDFRLTQSHATSTRNIFLTDDQLTKRIAAIPQWHLFGKYGVVDLPVTSLAIRLIGVIKATPDTASRVIISESNQSGKIYKAGDILPLSNVKIDSITAEGVVLNNGGRLEKLTLPRTPLTFQGMPKSLGE